MIKKYDRNSEQIQKNDFVQIFVLKLTIYCGIMERGD